MTDIAEKLEDLALDMAFEDDRQTLRSAASLIREQREALENIGLRARRDGHGTFDDLISDIGWIDDECRRMALLLSPAPEDKG